MASSEDDPTVEAAPVSAWVAWIARITRREPERIAQFGGAVGVGILSCVALMYVFLKLADDVLDQETTAFDQSVATLARRWVSPEVDTVARGVSLFGSEVVLVGGGRSSSRSSW